MGQSLSAFRNHGCYRLRFPTKYSHLASLFPLLLLIFLSACDELPEYQACEGTLLASSPVLTNGFGFNIHNTRNQNHSLISSANVQNLKLAFTLVDPIATEKRGAPAATEQTIFLSTKTSVVAADRRSGCAYWVYNHKDPIDRMRSASVHLIDDPSLTNRIIIVGTFLGKVIALNANTGQKIWQKDLTTVPLAHMITGGFQYHNGKLIVPVATKEVITAAIEPICCLSHGMLVSLEINTGEKLWTYQTTANAKLNNASFHLGPNGVSIWSTPLVDVTRNQVLVGTSQNLTLPYTDNENSVVALDMDTGSVRWIFQGTPNDAYNASCDLEPPLIPNCDAPDLDFDMITPILTNTTNHGDIIIAGDKAGFVYALKPNDGSLIWQKMLGTGGKLGGIHWGLAVDHQHVYAAIADVTAEKSLGSAVLDIDLGNLGSINVPMIQVENAQPGIYALSLNDGDVQWSVHDQHIYEGELTDSIYSAALTVSNDLLIAGSLNGVVKAWRSSDGQELWSFNTAISVTDPHGHEGNGGTIESAGPVIAGDQLLLNSGYDTFGGTNQFQAGPGNALFVFSL